MDDLVTIALLSASAFFAALSIGMLYRYRQVSTQIVTSNDLGKDLWSALETRMKKQDERILDMMGRVEVIQSRALQQSVNKELRPEGGDRVESSEELGVESGRDGQNVSEVTQALRDTSRVTTQPSEQSSTSNALEVQLKRQDDHVLDLIERVKLLESRLAGRMQSGRPESPVMVSQTLPNFPLQPRESADKVSEKVLLEMLREKPRTSVEIRERFGITREHAARVLKELFDRGVVVRNDSHKPFVYELTELGRQSV
jgi:predicted transcriptional regulator